MSSNVTDFAEIPTVKVNGSPLAHSLQLVDIRIDRGLNTVSGAALRFAGSLEEVGTAVAKLGAEVLIASPGGATAFKGEVTGIEVERDGAGDHVTTITALDPLHQLTGRSRVVARTKKKVSDVLGQIAGEIGLGADITATTVEYEYLFQTGTDLDYLSELAERAGLDWWCHDGKFHAKAIALGTTMHTIDSRNLERLSVRASGRRPEKVTVSGWDPKAGRAITGNATLSGTVLGASGKLADAVVKFKPRLAQEHWTSTIPVVEPQETKVVADAALSRSTTGALRVELEGPAMWAVGLGDTVSLKEAGDLDGKYVVSTIEHRVAEGMGSTRLIAGPRHPAGLMGGPGTGALHGRTPGIVTAKVTNIDDPENLGRVKVKFLGLDESQESAWARVLMLNAGPNTGATTLPEVGDEVLASFENNDVRRPVVLGSLYSSKTTLPVLERKGGKFTKVSLMERYGHQILLWADGNNQGITIKLKNGGELTIDQDGTRLVGVAGKTTTLTQGQAKIEMKHNGDIAINGTNITIKANAKLALEASAQAMLKGATVTVEGQATTDVKAAKVAVNGSGMLELKGGIVQIN